MQSMSRGDQRATWFTWLLRGVSLLMFILVSLFLVLVSLKVPVLEELSKQKDLVGVEKTKITSILNEVKPLGEATFKSEESKFLLKYDADRLKVFMEEQELEASTSYKDFQAKVAESKDSTWTGLGEDRYLELTTEITANTMTEAKLVSAAGAMGAFLDAHVAKINSELKPTAAVVQNETGRNINYTATIAKVGELKESLQAYVSAASDTTFSALMEDLIGYRTEFVNAAQNVLDDITAEQDVASNEHKTLLWCWIIFELLSLLASAALLTMADMEFIGGNEKFNRIYGGVLFLLTAVQLILIIHFGIFAGV